MKESTKNIGKQMHHFDIEDAMKYGVEKAVVLSNIRFWLNNNKNKDLPSVKHDGYYWMYNTAKDMSNVLPYFTQSKVQRLLKQLEDDGVLIVGNYNKVKYDRTKWYTLSEFTYNNNCITQTPELNIGNEQTVQPIQDSKTNTKTNNKINIPFSDFWNKYDYCKGKKSDVEAKWIALSDEERTLTMESLDKYLISTPDKTYRKYPMSYLNTEAWNDEVVLDDSKTTDNQNNAQPSVCNRNNAINNDVYSASFKPFEDNIGNHTKDDLECNLEALGYCSDTTTDSKNTTDSTVVNKTNKDIAQSDIITPNQLHWSELKAKGLLKTKVNPNAVAPNTDADKKISEFLARNSSNRYKDKIYA